MLRIRTIALLSLLAAACGAEGTDPVAGVDAETGEGKADCFGRRCIDRPNVGPFAPPFGPRCASARVTPDVATDGQRVYLDPAVAHADMRAALTGFRYNDAPPSTAHPEGEGREQSFAGCQRVLIETVPDPDGVPRSRPFITVPANAPTGDYAIQLLPASGACPSGGSPGQRIDTGCVTPTLAVARSFIVSQMDWMKVNSNSEDDDDNPAEMQFFWAARSGAAFGAGDAADALVKWSGMFPGGGNGSAHLTNDDNTFVQAHVPLFVGRETLMSFDECREECFAAPAGQQTSCNAACDSNRTLGRFNDQLEFGLAGAEYDGSPSKIWGVLAGIVTGGLTCYLGFETGLPKEGCTLGVGLGTFVANSVNKALSDDDDKLGVASGHADLTSDWNAGVPQGPVKLGGSTKTGGDVDLFFTNLRVGGPRILSYAVRLKSIKITDDYEENDCGGPADVFLNARASLYQGGTQLDDTTRLPATGTWEISQGATESWGGAAQIIGQRTFTVQNAPESPFLYIELGVWEDDSEKDLIGLFADTVLLSDLIGSRFDATEGTTPEGFFTRRTKTTRSAFVQGYAGSDNHCYGIWAHGWNPHAREGGAELTYEIDVTWLKAPPRR